MFKMSDFPRNTHFEKLSDHSHVVFLRVIALMVAVPVRAKSTAH